VNRFIAGKEDVEAGSIAARVTTPGCEAGTQALTASTRGNRRIFFMDAPPLRQT
jgi:hypothetical protein